MIQIKGLSKTFAKNKVLEGIDFHVDRGEVVAVIGPSGSGKTTLLRCISFLEKADAGRFILNNGCEDETSYDMTRVSTADIRRIRSHMGYVFQNFNLFKNMTALDNCMVGLIRSRHMDRAEAADIAGAVLNKVGLSDRMNHFPGELSGGQQQRVAIARALALNPDVILLDEPTSALDPELTIEVLDTIRKLAEEGTTMVMVTHQMSFAAEAASRVVFMEDAHIIEEGRAADVLEHPVTDRMKDFLSKR